MSQSFTSIINEQKSWKARELSFWVFSYCQPQSDSRQPVEGGTNHKRSPRKVCALCDSPICKMDPDIQIAFLTPPQDSSLCG